MPWTDILEIIPANALVFSTSGNSIPGREDDNLCLKAYHLLQKEHKLPAVKIHLHKIIPTGAGLGGGSADAAHTLRLLNSIFQLNIAADKLMHYASALGSDCAFFIQDLPRFGAGRGEVLTAIEISLKGKFLVLVKPELHVSTEDAYANVNPKHQIVSLQNTLIATPIDRWKDVVKNDFEESVFKKFPEIKAIKEKMYLLGAVYASMSGSGSSVFGIFNSPVSSENFSGLTKWSGILH